VNILLWHVHGSWTTAFVQGAHNYFVPVTPDRGPDGRGRAQTWEWPSSVIEVTPESAREQHIDVVLCQRPHELTELVEAWTGRGPGGDLPAIYLEHSCPQGRIDDMRHVAADRSDLVLVHVTHFNRLFWDAGSTETAVIEHGIVDPGYRYTGELEHAAVVVNEPLRRGRVTGTDLLERLARACRIDLFGMATEPLRGSDVPQGELHDVMARRRVYLHPIRWTSLGLSLLEAMHLGMPVVTLQTTEAAEAVPSEAGVCSNDLSVIEDALVCFMRDPEEARRRGKAGRAAALDRYGLERFLTDWDHLLERVAG
jgi:glycosyltransferase involved in cell wall biosynthesis